MGASPTYVPVIRTGVDVSFGDLTVTGTLSVAGAATLDSTLSVAGAATLDSLAVTGAATVGGTLGVTGIATFDANAVFTQGLTADLPSSMNDVDAAVVTATQLQVNGTATVTGDATFQSGIKVTEGANASMGIATLTLGSVTVNTSRVSATSRIFLTVQQIGTVSTPQPMTISGVTPGTSFQIVSADATDTSSVAWHIIEPA